MSTDSGERPRRNYFRRATGIAVCLAPVALLVASLFTGKWWRGDAMGLGVIVCALPVAILNLHLSFVRPALYRWRCGSMQDSRGLSGFPLFGTLLVVIGGVLGFGDWRAASAGLFALALDTGGLPWILLMTWHDNSLWDE